MNMSNLTSMKWWTGMLVSTFVTMLFIVLIKRVLTKFNLPLAAEMAKEV